MSLRCWYARHLNDKLLEKGKIEEGKKISQLSWVHKKVRTISMRVNYCVLIF